jgi:hypothetical protein
MQLISFPPFSWEHRGTRYNPISYSISWHLRRQICQLCARKLIEVLENFLSKEGDKKARIIYFQQSAISWVLKMGFRKFSHSWETRLMRLVLPFHILEKHVWWVWFYLFTFLRNTFDGSGSTDGSVTGELVAHLFNFLTSWVTNLSTPSVWIMVIFTQSQICFGILVLKLLINMN